MDELVAAMEWKEQERARQVAYAAGEAAERRRIREAVAALRPLPGESEPSIGERWWHDRQATILAIIDGKA